VWSGKQGDEEGTDPFRRGVMVGKEFDREWDAGTVRRQSEA